MGMGFIDLHNCESAPSLPYFLIIYSGCMTTTAVMRYIFRIPNFGWINGTYDPKIICTKFVGTLQLIIAFLGFWSAAIVIPNLGHGFSSSSPTSSTSTTSTGSYTGTSTASSLLKEHKDWQCSTSIYSTAFVCTITCFLTLLIATVVIIRLAIIGELFGPNCFSCPGYCWWKKEEEEGDENSDCFPSDDENSPIFENGEQRASLRNTVMIDRPAKGSKKVIVNSFYGHRSNSSVGSCNSEV